MHSYEKTRYPAEVEGLMAEGRIYVQEKLDGANFRFTVTESGEIKFGSRNMDNESIDRQQFADAIEFVTERVEPHIGNEDTPEPLAGHTYFGEAMIPHSIEYADAPPFVGFDVYNPNFESYEPHDITVESFYRLDLPCVPSLHIFQGENFRAFLDDLDDSDVPQSEYGDVQAEGLVFKNATTQARAKYVRESFREERGVSSSEPLTAEQELQERYCPPARIKSVAHGLTESPEKSLQMELMTELPEAVIRDMAQEAGGNLFMEESDEIDLHDFRSAVSSACATTLRGMLQ